MLDSSFKSERHNKSDVSVSEETSRILKLRERVNTAQQKLQLLENTKRDARRIFSKLTDSDSPVRPSKDYSSNSVLGLNPRQHFTEHEHDKSNRLSVTRQNIIDEPETDISQILPTNNKQRVLKEILVKMDLFRLNSPSTQKILDYFHEKIEGSKPYYYDFLRENNILVLKVLIQILYEEMEGISNDLEQSTTANSHQLDVLEKKLQDKTILCDRLTGELVQQNIELENLKKRMGPVTQDGNRVSIDHLFFVELKLLLQNILEEVFNSDADMTQDQRMNFRYITKSLLDKLAKVDIESLKETYTEDPYRSQDLPRPAQDRTSLKYMFGGEKSALRGRGEQQQGYESKFRRDAEEDNMRGELLSEINTLKGENRDLRRQLDAKKKGGEQRNVSSNQDILMDELKRALNEKEKLEDEFQKLKQIYNISKEEINNLSNDIYKVTAEREKEQEILTHENRELKAAMATLEREVKNLEVRLRDDVGKMDAELNNAKERIGTMLEEKTVTERELFQLRVDKKELQAKLQSYEVHIDELVTERETVLANVTTFDDLVKNKNIEIERLKRDNVQLEQAVHELREKEKILVEENEFIGNLKHEKVALQKELKDAKEALKGSEEKLVAFQEEKKMFHNKLTTLEAFDTNQLTSASLEQLSKGIIAQSNIDVRLTEDERSKLQEIISSKFMQALIPIKHKLKKSESSVSEYKGKYRDKLLNLLERLEDSKWLTNIILQANDALARSDNEQIPGTLIVFKEELERKKEVIKGKLKEMIQQQESNQIELKKVFDEQENQAESFRDNFGLEIKYEDELEKVKDENEKMKAKLQTQSYEIAALNSQLKLASTVEETNKRVLNPQSTRDMRSSRVMKGTRDASRMSHSRYQDEEEEGSKSQEAMTSPKDLLLMLQSQASSIEILLGNGF